MQLDLLVARSDEVVDDVCRGAVASGTTEPFVTSETFDNTTGRVNTAVSVLDVSKSCQDLRRIA